MIIILKYKDLKPSITTTIDRLKLDHFNISTELKHHAEVIAYMEGKICKILKSRYGSRESIEINNKRQRGILLDSIMPDIPF